MRGLLCILLIFLQLPGGKVSFLHLYIGTVDGKHVIDTVIQKSTVMRNEDKTLLVFQIRAYEAAPLKIQVVGGFIDQ